jgi:hypothetical protein
MDSNHVTDKLTSFSVKAECFFLLPFLFTTSLLGETGWDGDTDRRTDRLLFIIHRTLTTLCYNFRRLFLRSF